MDTCCQLVEEMIWTLPPASIDTISTPTLGHSIVSQMKNRRSMTLAVSLPGEDRLVVVGGVFAGFKQTDTIEVLE